MTWTLFWDMHSGGSTKIGDYDKIYIEAPEEEATRVFGARFAEHPDSVACACCGSNFSVSEADDLAQASGYHRGCDHDGDRYIERPSRYARKGRVVPLDEYLDQPHVLAIFAHQIADAERTAAPVEPYYADDQD